MPSGGCSGSTMVSGWGVPVSCLILVLAVLPLLPNIQPFPLICVLEPHPYDLPLPNFRWSLATGRDRLTVVAEVPSSTSGLKVQPFPRSGHHPSLCLQSCEGLKPPSCCWPKCAFPSQASSLCLCKQSLYQAPLMTPTHPNTSPGHAWSSELLHRRKRPPHQGAL